MNVHPHVTVLGAGVNALGIIRALGRQGLRVAVFHRAMDRGENLARFSRFCTARAIPAGPDFEARLLDALVRAEEGYLFATSDFYVSFIARNRKALGERHRFNIPDDDVLSLLVDKEQSVRAAAEAELDVPATLVPRSDDDPIEVANRCSYPCIIKPRDSFSVDFPGKNVRAACAYEVVAFARAYPELWGDVILQEIIPGDESRIYQCTMYVGLNGRRLAAYTMRKIHQFPPNYGITTLGVSAPEADLMSRTVNFLASIGLTGFASVEYKQSDSDGRYYFIEGNPRLPWYNSLFYAAGLNFPVIAVRDLAGEPTDTTVDDFRQDVQWVYFRNELAGWWQHRRTNRRESLLALMRSLARCNSYAYWSASDPLPFLAAMVSFLGWGIGKVIGGRR